MSIPTYTKHKDAKLDYGFDLAEEGWLETGETVSSVVWTVPTGLTEDTGKRGNDGSKIWTYLSGGTAGASYSVSAKFTTSEGRIDSRSFNLRIVSNR